MLVVYDLSTMSYDQVIERREFAMSYARAMMSMIKMYQGQDDRTDSIRKCAEDGKVCCLEAKRIDLYLESFNEPTVILQVA